MKGIFKKILVIAIAALTVFSFSACGGEKLAVTYSEVVLTGEQYGYCVAPNDTALLNSVNELLEEIKADGTLDKLYEAEENGTASHIGSVKTESSNRANELLVATNAEFAPFEYKKGAYFAGIDMQIAKLLADKLNKTLVICDMDFDAVVVSVSQGMCDIGMAGLTISDGRAENVTFSSAYYDTTQVVAYAEGDETFASCTTKEEVEAAIASLTNVKAGAATGQTGSYYLLGSEDFGFGGFSNVKVNLYDTVALAIQDLSNGKVKFVVGDKDTVKAAIAGMAK